MKLPRSLRLIPSLGLVGGALPACSDPIIGDWEVTRIKGKALPITYTDDGVTYSISAAMKVEDDGDVDFEFTYSARGSGQSYSKSFVKAGSWDKVGRRAYEIEFGNDELDCTIADGELECDDDDGDRFLEAEPAD